MSKYSGKCDFADVVEIWGEDIVLNCEICIGEKQIYPKSIKDLYPYFGTLISGMGIGHEINPDTGKYGRIYLCEKPYYEERKEEIRQLYKDNEKTAIDLCEQIDNLYKRNLDELLMQKENQYKVSYFDKNSKESKTESFKTHEEAQIFAEKLENSKDIIIEKYEF